MKRGVLGTLNALAVIGLIGCVQPEKTSENNLYDQLLVSGVFASNAEGDVELMDTTSKTLNLALSNGQSIRFLVKENGTTGYLWNGVVDNGKCSVNVEHLSPKSDGTMVGVPGKARVTIKRIDSGDCNVTLKYMRSWEPNAPASVIVISVHDK